MAEYYILWKEGRMDITAGSAASQNIPNDREVVTGASGEYEEMEYFVSESDFPVQRIK